MYTPQWMSLLVVVFTYHSRIIRSCDAVTIAGEGLQHFGLAPTPFGKGHVTPVGIRCFTSKEPSKLTHHT